PDDHGRPREKVGGAARLGERDGAQPRRAVHPVGAAPRQARPPLGLARCRRQGAPSRDVPVLRLRRVTSLPMRPLFSLLSPKGTGSRLSILIFHRVLATRDPLFPSEPTAEDFEEIVAWVNQW